LTARGREQARELGRRIADDRIEICIVSEFPRTQQTAEMALEGRNVPCVVDPNLNDLRYGELEGVSKERYHAWKREHSLSTPLLGGESLMQVAERLCVAMERLLERPERYALVVTHELLIADLMHAIAGQSPAQPHADIPYAAPYRLSAKAISRAISFLSTWLSTQPS
jgi:broad specificity phosphatase PhoE